MPPKASSTCDHNKLMFGPSLHASVAGYKRPNLSQRVAAATPQGTIKPAIAKKGLTGGDEKESAFPAPLILPKDELTWDPSYPAQSLRSWIREKDRNKVTSERRTVYLAGPPTVQLGLEYIQKWARPQLKRATKEEAVDFPETKDVLAYLQAFYHGMPVKMISSPHLQFTADVDEAEPSPQKKGRKSNSRAAETKPQMLWLNTQTSSGCVGIRARATPKGDFTHQLNLNDLLDAAIEILPDDAYALLILVEHDIYEDDDDDFACGRAYGGSRIAVVSGARYNPILDRAQGLERDHAWPASHCETYMQNCCDAAEDEEQVGISVEESSTAGGVMTPIHAALEAHIALPSLDQLPGAAALSGLWLGRVCRTASHELGHCFGMDHCVYYACSMQGTASVVEDARQPPYLCPVDLAKVLKASGTDERERYRALLALCDTYQEAHLFAAYGAWIRARLGREA